MSDMKDGIRTYLLADATLKAALSSTTAVYSFPAPQDAVKPYLMLSRPSGTIQNLIGSSLDVYDETWQIDIMASTDATAESIKELVIGRMNIADRVEMGSYTAYSCSFDNVTDNSDLEMIGSETGDIRKSLTFLIKRDRTATP